MSTARVRKVLGWTAGGVVCLFLLAMVATLLAESFYGGRHVVLEGESHGFRIGMTKAEVFNRYRALDESENIRAYSTNGSEHYAQGSDASAIQMDAGFQSSDHWMGYRRKWPVHFQEFYFSEGKLTNITTYIRFYETL